MLIKNKMMAICVIFTILTITASTLNLVQGVAQSGNNHILLRFVVVVLAVGSLFIFDWFKQMPLYKVHLIHYVTTLGAVLLTVWFSGFFIQLHPDAYRDIFLNYTVIYIIITMVEVIYLRLKGRNNSRMIVEVKPWK